MKVNAVEATSPSTSWQNIRKAFYLTYFMVNTLNRNRIRAWLSSVSSGFYVMVVSGSSFNKEGVEINFVETWSADGRSSGFCMVLHRAKSWQENPMITQSADFMEESRGAAILGHGRCTWVEVSISLKQSTGKYYNIECYFYSL